MKVIITAYFVLLAGLLYGQLTGAAKITKGQDLFERRCTGCHRLDEIRVGPPLRNVFGRVAGTETGFPYSDSLKAASD